MRKLIYIVILLVVSGGASFLSGKNFYFPEYQVLIPAPAGWYAYNGSTIKGGNLIVSNEKITGRPRPSQIGITLFCGQEKARDTDHFASKIFPLVAEKLPNSAQKEVYELEGKLGTFKFLEMIPGDSFQPVMATGVLKNSKGSYVAVLFSPREKWDSFKSVLLGIVKSIRLCMTGRPGDTVVYSVKDDILSELCKRTDRGQKDILLARFKSLKKGMTEARYREIMKYEWKKPKGRKVGANFTPGLLKTIPVSVNNENYVDVYGVYNRCIGEELFYVRIAGKKIKRLKLIKRPYPGDFDIEEWGNFLVGPVKNRSDMIKLFAKLITWSTDPPRARLAVKRLENVKIGMTEQEYLTAAQSFMIHFSLVSTYRVIPGVFKINTAKDPVEGIKREYIYASREGKKMVSVKKVVVLDGKVTAITRPEKEELTKPALTCNPKVVKPGGIILVDFTAPSDYPSNAWVGIVPSHISHGLETVNDYYDVSYKYLKNRARGALFFTAPMKPGDYDFRMNESDDGGKEVCSISFKVKAPETKKEKSPESIKVRLMTPPRLIKKVNPKYPKEALENHIQGKVIVNATTDIFGRVVSAEAVEGPEMLRPASVEAVKQWKYEPYLLNEVPRPVMFTVKVKFALAIKKKKQ
jgi:TonB family protein